MGCLNCLLNEIHEGYDSYREEHAGTDLTFYQYATLYMRRDAIAMSIPEDLLDDEPVAESTAHTN